MYCEKILAENKSRSVFRLFQFIFNWWRMIPSQITYFISSSKQKELVRSDFGSCGNLFYHRMGKTSIFYFWILSGENSLKLPFSCKLGRHTHFVHNDCCHLNAASIGDNFVCYPHVMIGAKNLRDNSKPTIGNNVTLGSGTVVVGGIHIGDNVNVGANTVVMKDIPDNSVVYGNPCIVMSKGKK